jgi:murein DD-endopeptidase MepM/ murein hydrolase activator NlpD
MRRKVLWIAALLLAALLAAAFWYFLRPGPESVVEIPAAPVPKMMYGIRIDSLQVESREIKSGQNLSTILSAWLTPQQIDQLARNTRTVFDVRKIRPGHRCIFFLTADSLPRVRFFVYEITPIEYIRYTIGDSITAVAGKKAVRRVVRTASGVISSSLWNAFAEQKLDVELALALSEVYAWTIDFYGLQKGDRFKVIYDELSVDSVLIGSDRIHAALFENEGSDHYAFYFDTAGTSGYFSETGQSLRRSFLKAPLRFSRISSRFSRSRMHPILKIRRPHYGVDYAAPRGTPVVALGDGTVKQAGFHGGYGRFISIRHNSIYTTTYAHLSGYAKGIAAGRHVSQGDVIGYVGSSGLATGPHLDFRVYKNGTPVDPMKMESPPTDPVQPGLIPRYEALVKDMTVALDSIPW